MYSVSLLPSEYRALHQSVKRKDIRLLIAMGVMSIIAVAYLVLYITVSNMDREYQALQEENVSLIKQIDKLKDLEELNAQLDSLEAKFIAAVGLTPDWSEIITQIGNSVPESVGLETIEFTLAESSENNSDGSTDFNPDDYAHKCVVTGTATNHGAIAQWLKDLESIEYIKDIRCSFSVMDSQDISALSKFELTFSLLASPISRLDQEVFQ